MIFFYPPTISATVRINELYPAPAQDEFEWLELYNDSESEQRLDVLIFYDAKQNRIPVQAEKILPHEYLVATFSGILNNSGGDSVIMIDGSGATLERVDYASDFQPGQSYSRCRGNDADNWIRTQPPTKLSDNIASCITPTPTATSAPSPTTTMTPTPTSTLTPTPRTKYGKIYINEVMSYPKEGDAEWIELYNDNDFSVELNGWKIDDIDSGGSNPKVFTASIEKKSFITVELSSSMFNNGGDRARLLDHDHMVIDEVGFSAIAVGTSWNRINFGTPEMCQQSPSPKKNNFACAQPPTTAIADSPAENRAQTEYIETITPVEKTNTPKLNTRKIEITPPPWYLLGSNSDITAPEKNASPSGEVLGISDESRPYPIILPAISSISSLLTIAVGFYKMSQNVR